MNNYSVTLETLKSKLHNEKAIEKGIELWKRDKVAFEPTDEGGFRAQVADKDETRGVLLAYSSDGCDLEHYYCHCRPGREGAVCKHIVAAVLAIQGGVTETGIILGKTSSICFPVAEMGGIGEGCDAALSMSALVAWMEKAACAVLEDGINAEQISVGISISVEQKAVGAVGISFTATATITSVVGRRIELALSVRDEAVEIAHGTHSRMILDRAALSVTAKGLNILK